MDAAAIATMISVVSLVIAGMSLGWQIVQWLLSAGRPKATLMHGLADRSRAVVGPVGKDQRGFDVESIRAQGFGGEHVLGIEVANHGRAPVVIDRISVCLRGGKETPSYVPGDDLIGPPTPYTLQPGANVAWYAPYRFAELLAQSTRDVFSVEVSGVYMTARLGTGKIVATPQTISM